MFLVVAGFRPVCVDNRKRLLYSSTLQSCFCDKSSAQNSFSFLGYNLCAQGLCGQRRVFVGGRTCLHACLSCAQHGRCCDRAPCAALPIGMRANCPYSVSETPMWSEQTHLFLFFRFGFVVFESCIWWIRIGPSVVYRHDQQHFLSFSFFFTACQMMLTPEQDFVIACDSSLRSPRSTPKYHCSSK